MHIGSYDSGIMVRFQDIEEVPPPFRKGIGIECDLPNNVLIFKPKKDGVKGYINGKNVNYLFGKGARTRVPNFRSLHVGEDLEFDWEDPFTLIVTLPKVFSTRENQRLNYPY
jgi:hypothetical protein